MAYSLISVDINAFLAIDNREKYLQGKFVRAINCNHTDGRIMLSFPLDNEIVKYPINPVTNQGYLTTVINKIYGSTPLSFPLDAKFDHTRGLTWIADTGNGRVISINENNEIMSETKNISIPYSICPNFNVGGVFVLATYDLNNGIVYNIDSLGKIKSYVIFPFNFPYSSLNITKTESWITGMPQVDSMSFDALRNKLWWTADKVLYMMDCFSKNICSLNITCTSLKSVQVDEENGNAFVLIQDQLMSFKICQVHKDNTEVLGCGYINKY